MGHRRGDGLRRIIFLISLHSIWYSVLRIFALSLSREGGTAGVEGKAPLACGTAEGESEGEEEKHRIRQLLARPRSAWLGPYIDRHGGCAGNKSEAVRVMSTGLVRCGMVEVVVACTVGSEQRWQSGLKRARQLTMRVCACVCVHKQGRFSYGQSGEVQRSRHESIKSFMHACIVRVEKTRVKLTSSLEEEISA